MSKIFACLSVSRIKTVAGNSHGVVILIRPTSLATHLQLTVLAVRFKVMKFFLLSFSEKEKYNLLIIVLYIAN